jgi:hypothetical protein
MSGTARQPRFIKPANVLKQKVGSGGLSDDIIDNAQTFIEENNIDFLPYAESFLEEFSKRIRDYKSLGDDFENRRDALIRPVMQLKANGGMFRYRLVSDVADIALQFLEAIEEINEDGINVLKAHEKTIRIIIDNKLAGDGGSEGYDLVKELDGACKRYFSKHA